MIDSLTTVGMAVIGDNVLQSLTSGGYGVIIGRQNWLKTGDFEFVIGISDNTNKTTV